MSAVRVVGNREALTERIRALTPTADRPRAAQTKVCVRCGEHKGFSKFRLAKGAPRRASTLTAWCNTCREALRQQQHAQRRATEQEHPEVRQARLDKKAERAEARKF